MENGFQGKEGQQVPEMTDEFVNSVSERYIELYEKITGEKFVKADAKDVLKRVEENILGFLEKNL
jgi:phosphoribosylaminoimidazole-succinocarboxamide synthase